MSLAHPKNVVPFSSLWTIVLFYRFFYNSLRYSRDPLKFLLRSCIALLTDEHLVSSEIIYNRIYYSLSLITRRYPWLKPWHFAILRASLDAQGRNLIHPRASPWNSALRVIRGTKTYPELKYYEEKRSTIST